MAIRYIDFSHCQQHRLAQTISHLRNTNQLQCYGWTVHAMFVRKVATCQNAWPWRKTRYKDTFPKVTLWSILKKF